MSASVLADQDSLISSDSLTVADSRGVLIDGSEDSTQILSHEIRDELEVYTEEDSYRRWLTLSLNMSNSIDQIGKPIIYSEPHEGRFTLSLVIPEGHFAPGKTLLKDVGHFPLQYEISIIDDDSIKVHGNTRPFEFIKSTYSFDSNEYLIEIIYSDNFKVAEQSKPEQVPANPNISSETKLPRLATSRSSDLKDLFMRSLVIAGGSFAIILLLIMSWFILRVKRRKTSGQNFGDILEERSSKDATNTVESAGPARAASPQVMTPEQKEAKVREIMDQDGLTYDEAMLRIQYDDPGQ